MPIYNISPTWRNEVQNKARGGIPTCDNSSISDNLVAWNQFKTLLEKSANNGSSFSQQIVSTYSLAYTATASPYSDYSGGVLAPNGDIHLVPFTTNRGQKISSSGVVSTYSLVFTAGIYSGGVLAPNGDIHFVPLNIPFGSGITMRGQKININGVVSTYSLIYTTTGAYYGGVLSPNGDIHFVPFAASVGQKISSNGIVSTYSLAQVGIYYDGGVLSPNGDIYFISSNSVFGPNIGQKISTLPAKPLNIGVCCSPFLNKY
jgi:hypothetical protein